ncbi:MAG: hypothetical protein OEQ39_15100 [Gammaproteobacteria bacterium]|nr:hypothetical protein [Gammaproteobacteria bacterium]
MTKQQRTVRALIRWVVMPALIVIGAVFMIKGYGIEALLVYVILALFMIWMELKELRLQLASCSRARK